MCIAALCDGRCANSGVLPHVVVVVVVVVVIIIIAIVHKVRLSYLEQILKTPDLINLVFIVIIVITTTIVVVDVSHC